MSTEEKPNPGKKIPWLQLLLCINILCALGTIFIFWSHYTSGTRPPLTENQAEKELMEATLFKDKPIVYTLDSFTVNLGGSEQKIIQIEVALEMIDEDGFEEIVSISGHARDTIVNILNGKSYDEVSSVQGKLFLKDEIIVALNQHLDQSFVKNIYFSRFMVQEI